MRIMLPTSTASLNVTNHLSFTPGWLLFWILPYIYELFETIKNLFLL